MPVKFNTSCGIIFTNTYRVSLTASVQLSLQSVYSTHCVQSDNKYFTLNGLIVVVIVAYVVIVFLLFFVIWFYVMGTLMKRKQFNLPMEITEVSCFKETGQRRKCKYSGYRFWSWKVYNWQLVNKRDHKLNFGV